MGVIADKIRRAIFGGEVRDSIADGIEVVEQLREDYDNQVINAGNSNAEIVDARGGQTKLKDRLDNFDEQLDTIENKKLDKDGIVTMVNMGQDVKEAITGGSVAVVGKGAIGKENVLQKAIEINHTNFLKQGEINLCYYTNFELNKAVAPTNGGTFELSGYKTSDYIAIESATNYASNECLNVAFYDANKTYISGLQGGTWSNPFVTPTNAKYLKISYTSSTSPILNKGSKLYSECEIEITNTKLDNLLKNYIYNNINNALQYITDKNIKNEKLEFISETDYINLYNSTTANVDKAINPDSGVMYGFNGYTASDYIPIKSATQYCCSQQNHIAFYDINKTYISGLKNWSNPLTTPTNAKYLRITFTNGATNPQFSKGSTLVTYQPYGVKYINFENNFLTEIIKSIGANKLNNLKWNALGDSITEGPNYLGFKSYVYYLSQKYTMNTVNYGVSSSRIAKSSARTDSFIERYLNMRDNVNIVSVKGGTNDFLESTPMGSFSSTSETEFYGALHILCKGLKEKYYNIPIFFMTPIINSNKSTNSLGFKLTDYCKAIKEVCAYYGIPVLDLNSLCQIDPTITNIKNNYITDGVHPNDNGHILYIMPLVEDYMKKLL